MYDDDSDLQHMDDTTGENHYDDVIDSGDSLPDSDPTELHELLEDLNLTDEEFNHISELLQEEENNVAPEDVPEENHSHDISFKAGSSSCVDSCWNTCAGTCSGSCMVRDY